MSDLPRVQLSQIPTPGPAGAAGSPAAHGGLVGRAMQLSARAEAAAARALADAGYRQAEAVRRAGFTAAAGIERAGGLAAREAQALGQVEAAGVARQTEIVTAADAAQARARAEQITEMMLIRAEGAQRVGEAEAAGARQLGAIRGRGRARTGEILAAGRQAVGQIELESSRRIEAIQLGEVRGVTESRARVAGEIGQIESETARQVMASLQSQASSALRLTAAIAGVAQRYYDQKLQAQRAADLARAQTAATVALDNLAWSMRDADPRTAYEQYVEASEAVLGTVGDGLDDVTRPIFERDFARMMLVRANDVRRDAFKREQDDQIAGLDDLTVTLLNLASSTDNQRERLLLVGQYKAALGNAVHAGYLTDRQYVKRVNDFVKELDAATARNMIRTDPEQALLMLTDGKSLSGMLPEQRAILADQAQGEVERRLRERMAEADRAQRDQDRRDKLAGDASYRELLGMAFDGTLDRAALDARRDEITPTAYATLLRQLNGTTATKDDPDVYRRLTALVYTDPAAAQDEAMTAQAAGQIRNETLTMIIDKAQRLVKEPDPKEKFWRDFVVNSLPRAEQWDPTGGIRQQEALAAYMRYTEQPRSDQELETFARETVRRAALIDVQKISTALLQPPGITLNRNADPAELKADIMRHIGEVRAASDRYRATGEGDPAELAEQARWLRRWFDWINRRIETEAQ